MMDTCTWAPSDLHSSADSVSSLFSQPSSCPHCACQESSHSVTQVWKEPRTQLCPCVPASPWKCESSCCHLEEVWTLPILSPKRCLSPGLVSFLEGNSVSAMGKTNHGKPFLFKKMLSTRILQYLENLIYLLLGSGFDDQSRGLAVQGPLYCHWSILTPSVSSF